MLKEYAAKLYGCVIGRNREEITKSIFNKLMLQLYVEIKSRFNILIALFINTRGMNAL